MATFNSFEDIEAWQKGRELVKEVYLFSGRGEFSKDFGLKDQIRRAAISIISNIAEGFDRATDREFVQFLFYTKGSAGEVKAQLYAALDLDYISDPQFENLRLLVDDVRLLIGGLIQYLKKADKKRRKL